MAIILEVRQGISQNNYLLDRQSISIGRRSDNDVILEGQQISRHHARLAWSRGQLYLIDLASCNGTLVNNKRLAAYVPYPLKTNDIISIGNHLMDLDELKRIPAAMAAGELPDGARQANSYPWIIIAAAVMLILALTVTEWMLLISLTLFLQ
jgi:pSer/pThr/pTyr-binding forkhead associated (FHA) protein